MNKSLKKYIISVVISIIIAIFPWILAWIDIIPFLRALEYAWFWSFGSLIFFVYYVIKNFKECKKRIIVIFLNPALYYFFVITWIIMSFILYGLKH